MPQNLISDSATFTLYFHLFNQFLTDNDIDLDQAIHVVLISDFHKWLRNTRATRGLFPDREELQAAYGLADNEFEIINSIMDDPVRFAGLMSVWWPRLAWRGEALKHPPMAFSLAVAVQYEEDKVAHIPILIAQENCLEPFTNGVVGSLLKVNMNAILDMLVTVGGLDGLYKQHIEGRPIGHTHVQSGRAKAAMRGGPGF